MVLERNAGIARVLKGDGLDHAGMGIVVGQRYVVTCAHVASTAVGLPDRNTLKPTEEIAIDFPRAAAADRRYGHVVTWRPPGRNPEYDVAVIELTEEIPEGVGVAILADIQVPLSDDPLTIFGFAEGSSEGNPVAATFRSESTSVEVQIVGAGNSGLFLEEGYSGAAVWDDKHQVVVGMIRAIHRQRQERVAYMTPTISIAAVWLDLPHETRLAPLMVSRLWEGLAVLFLGLLMFCFLVNQSGDFNLSPQLAGFAGMHVYVVGGLLLVWLWYRHSRNYELHPWIWRIPGLAGMKFGPDRGTRRTLCYLTLLFFVLLPIYLQGHFIKKFHAQGHVYFYSREFGFDEAELTGCLASQGLCTHPCVGRYSIIEPRPGFKGGYWDNMYQYGGDRRPQGKESVTFWPILQPVAIIVLTLLIVGAQFVMLWTFRRSNDLPFRSKVRAK